MLRTLRKKAKPVFWIVIIFFVATIFISWGMDFSAQYFAPQIAAIDGRQIPPEEYNQALNEFQESIKEKYGKEFDIDRHYPKLRETVLDNLIKKYVVLAEAKRQGIRVSEDELSKEIIRSFADTSTYNQYVHGAPAIWWRDKEQKVRKSIIIDKMLNLAIGQVSVTEPELKAYYAKEYEKAGLQQILIDPKKLIPLDEVEKYLQKNQEDFMKPGDIRARHILIKTAENANPQEVAAAQAKIEGLAKQLNEGADFAALAQANSDCPSKERGGDLGYFGLGQMVPEFEKVAFKLEKGDVSGIVKTKFGFHIIKVEDKLPEVPKKLDEVEDEIRELLVTDETTKTAKKLARDLRKRLLTGEESFSELAITYSHAKSAPEGGYIGIIPKRFIPFDTGTNTLKLMNEEVGIMGYQLNDEFSKAAFSLKDGQISKVIETSLGFHVIKMVKRLAPSQEDFAKDYNKILATCLLDKRNNVYDDWYTWLAQKAKIVKGSY